MRTKAIFVSLILSGVALAADPPEFPLWANGAPGSEGKTAKEVDEPPNRDHGYLKVTSVHNPSITVFLPPSEVATGAAIVIAPGGGHQFLNFDQEGTYVVAYLNRIGVAGFVLKYRLAREPGSRYKIEEHALADAQRAIRLVRSRAEEWHVNPTRAGMMGFSAGGEVAALASTRFDAGKPESADPIDHLSSRPDFDALIYPGVRAENYIIPKDMPVTFMLCADNDRGPSTALAGLYPLLKAASIKTEVDIYASGGQVPSAVVRRRTVNVRRARRNLRRRVRPCREPARHRAAAALDRRPRTARVSGRASTRHAIDTAGCKLAAFTARNVWVVVGGCLPPPLLCAEKCC